MPSDPRTIWTHNLIRRTYDAFRAEASALSPEARSEYLKKVARFGAELQHQARYGPGSKAAAQEHMGSVANLAPLAKIRIGDMRLATENALRELVADLMAPQDSKQEDGYIHIVEEIDAISKAFKQPGAQVASLYARTQNIEHELAGTHIGGTHESKIHGFLKRTAPRIAATFHYGPATDPTWTLSTSPYVGGTLDALIQKLPDGEQKLFGRFTGAKDRELPLETISLTGHGGYNLPALLLNYVVPHGSRKETTLPLLLCHIVESEITGTDHVIPWRRALGEMLGTDTMKTRYPILLIAGIASPISEKERDIIGIRAIQGVGATYVRNTYVRGELYPQRMGILARGQTIENAANSHKL